MTLLRGRSGSLPCCGFSSHGISLTGAFYMCEVADCTVSGNDVGIYLARNGCNGSNLVANCTIYGGRVGMELDAAICANISAVQVFQPTSHAFHLHSRTCSTVLTGCRTFQVGGDAVRVEDSHEFNATSNVFCWTRGSNIRLTDVSWASVNGNNIIDSGVRHHGDDGKPDGMWRRSPAVVVDGTTKGAQVVGNAIFNWGDQIEMDRAGVLCRGAGSVANGNVVQLYPAYQCAPHPTADFTTDAVDALIKKERGVAR
eukprot:gene10048-51407_t